MRRVGGVAAAVLAACSTASPGPRASDRPELGVEPPVDAVGTEALGGLAASEPAARTLVYACADLELVVRTGPGLVELILDGRSVILPLVRAASGAKYQEGDLVFWSKGDEARLEVDGTSYPNCARHPEREPWADARLRGVAFRGVGNEPPWQVEVSPGRQMVLVTDYGAQRVATPAPEPALEPATGRTSYRVRTGAHELEVVIEPSPCTDSMSGEAFEATVALHLDGRRLLGCGRWLAR